MTSPIDPVRKSPGPRGARRARVEKADPAQAPENRKVPVVIEGETAGPVPGSAPEGAAAFAAQLLGQPGERRGLRGGPQLLDTARTVYTRTEWSGPADRRARKGSITKTEI